jgi:small neutral amino acid transporter SnatA (MarC family)
MAIVTLNIWTGGPLLAVWIGSRFQPSSGVSMFAIAMVAVSLAIICYVLVRILARLDALHGRLSGRPSSVSRHVPWLRSMRGERPHEDARVLGLSSLERILVICVVLAVAVFEIWFFFYSSSPIDQRSGRDDTGAVTRLV